MTFCCRRSCFLRTSLLCPPSSRARIILSRGISSFSGSGPLVFLRPVIIPSWSPILETLLPVSSGRASFAWLSRMALSATCSRILTLSTLGRALRCFRSLRTTSAPRLFRTHSLPFSLSSTTLRAIRRVFMSFNPSLGAAWGLCLGCRWLFHQSSR